jgi:GTP cyclohydrolase II
MQVYVYGPPNASPNVLAVVTEDRPAPPAVPLVRLHSACVTGDVLGSLRCDCGEQLQLALNAVSNAPWGILLYLLDHEGRGIGLADKIRAYALQDAGLDTVQSNAALGLPIDARSYDAACHVLRDLGVTSLRLLTNNPHKLRAVRGNGLQVAERVPLRARPTRFNAHYLHVKQRALGHYDLGDQPAP